MYVRRSSMSTKIYDAFKVRDREQVWRVLEDVRERGEREVVEKLARYYRMFVDNVDPEDEQYKAARAKDQNAPEHSTRLFMAQMVIRDGFKKSATSMQRDFFDPDVSVALTWHETGFYLRAFCDRAGMFGGSLDFLNTHPDLEDFHYQNQCDRPRGITQEAWKERERIWDEMCVPPGIGPFKNQVILEISSWQKLWQLDPWLDVAREFNKSPPTFPIREEIFARRLRELEAFAHVAAEPGRITGTTKAGVAVLIEKQGKRKVTWGSQIGGQSWRHPTLDRAINWVEYQHLPAFLRERLDRDSPGVAEMNLLPARVRKRR